MSVDPESMTCEHCGGDVELSKSWTRKSFPLIGSEVEVREYICSDCAIGTRVERKENTDVWKRAT